MMKELRNAAGIPEPIHHNREYEDPTDKRAYQSYKNQRNDDVNYINMPYEEEEGYLGGKPEGPQLPTLMPVNSQRQVPRIRVTPYLNSVGTLGVHSAMESQIIHYHRQISARIKEKREENHPTREETPPKDRHETNIANRVKFIDEEDKRIEEGNAKWGIVAYAFTVQCELPEKVGEIIPTELREEYEAFIKGWEKPQRTQRTTNQQQGPRFLAMDGSIYIEERPEYLSLAQAYDTTLSEDLEKGKLLNKYRQVNLARTRVTANEARKWQSYLGYRPIEVVRHTSRIRHNWQLPRKWWE